MTPAEYRASFQPNVFVVPIGAEFLVVGWLCLEKIRAVHPLDDLCVVGLSCLLCEELSVNGEKSIHVLCRECDVSIQSANEHTLKHDRFLLAGVKLSASSSSQETPSPSNSAPDSLFDVSHKKHYLYLPSSIRLVLKRRLPPTLAAYRSI
ncbi:hypothetical protein VIGAN_04041600 [Vigna angularis var. angularis]|uniref:Uncharacterized protein n=1 Tax=Vigna angularis var. angularis TaxID=157739 RepID=A0A0S3RRX5_PHAAN|nr:hypothetical protein VIGAN_04041600 [Vigna angularis var. angularis]